MEGEGATIQGRQKGWRHFLCYGNNGSDFYSCCYTHNACKNIATQKLDLIHFVGAFSKISQLLCRN